MSTTLSGPIALLSPCPVDGLASSLEFNRQMWLGAGSTLTGVFRYYNSANDVFGPVGQYIGWIHVAKFVPVVDSHQQLNDSHQFVVENDASKPGTKNEDISPASSQTVADVEVVHIVGDIIQLIPTQAEFTQQQPYVNVSGIAINSNKADTVFDVNTGQYTSFYKYNKTLSIFPIRCNFSLNKYKVKRPIPNKNSYIAVEGFLAEIESDGSRVAAVRFRTKVRT
ncbi:hypothetical protein F5888DRAFT_1810178 [Russula emetica]|nr:hypothetical protein F5888DRAFT_1810178 [Russula emetica]